MLANCFVLRHIDETRDLYDINRSSLFFSIKSLCLLSDHKFWEDGLHNLGMCKLISSLL